MLRRIKRKNILLILLGVSMFTTIASAVFNLLALGLFILAMMSKIIGAILIGCNAYYVFEQIKKDNEDEIPDED